MAGRISGLRRLGVIALGAVAGQAVGAATIDKTLPPAKEIAGVWELAASRVMDRTSTHTPGIQTRRGFGSRSRWSSRRWDT